MTDRYEARLRTVEPEVVELLGRIPLQEASLHPPDWVRCEMLERLEILRHADLATGATLLEVGSGGHALSTVPLAHQVGPGGRVLAVERARWGQFGDIVAATGLGDRVRPVAADARRLPLRDRAADVAVCLHGLRSLGGEAAARGVLAEMLRVAPRILLAESLPEARTDAQRAHLAMYDLREEAFRARWGKPDDRRYVRVDRWAALVQDAGGRVDRTLTVDVDLPHYLARFPREIVEEIPDPNVRAPLLARWDGADGMLRRSGEDHPPVGVVWASRPSAR